LASYRFQRPFHPKTFLCCFPVRVGKADAGLLPPSPPWPSASALPPVGKAWWLAETPLALDNKAGSTTLLGLATLLQRARLVVSNETSAVHLAAAVGTPSVCILGGGHFGRFLPYAKSACHNIPHVVCHPMACYGCNWHCCYPRADGRAVACIDKITVDQAWEIVKPLLTMVDA
jgi:ADP-heptose:LPS heptosyltransferase